MSHERARPPAEPAAPGRGWLVAATGAGALVAVLAVLVATSWAPVLAADRMIADGVHVAALAHPLLARAAGWTTVLGDTTTRFLVSGLAGLLLAWRRAWDRAVLVVACPLLGGLVDIGIKDLVARPRPVWVHPIVHASGYAFPSGHTMGSMVTYGALGLVGWWGWRGTTRRLALVGLVVVTGLVGVSRVVLGVHWPSDVLGGWAAGLSWMVLTWAAWSATAARRRTSGELSVGPPEPRLGR